MCLSKQLIISGCQFYTGHIISCDSIDILNIVLYIMLWSADVKVVCMDLKTKSKENRYRFLEINF